MANQDNSSGGGFLAGLLIGGAIGAVIALLYAPQPGGETRGLIKQKSDAYTDLAKTKATELTAKATDLTEAAKTKANEISDRVSPLADSVRSRGAELADTAASKASQLSGTVKSAAADLSAKASDTVSSVTNKFQSGINDGKSAAAEQKQELTSEAPVDGSGTSAETASQI